MVVKRVAPKRWILASWEKIHKLDSFKNFNRDKFLKEFEDNKEIYDFLILCESLDKDVFRWAFCDIEKERVFEIYENFFKNDKMKDNLNSARHRPWLLWMLLKRYYFREDFKKREIAEAEKKKLEEQETKEKKLFEESIKNFNPEKFISWFDIFIKDFLERLFKKDKESFINRFHKIKDKSEVEKFYRKIINTPKINFVPINVYTTSKRENLEFVKNYKIKEFDFNEFLKNFDEKEIIEFLKFNFDNNNKLFIEFIPSMDLDKLKELFYYNKNIFETLYWKYDQVGAKYKWNIHIRPLFANYFNFKKELEEQESKEKALAEFNPEEFLEKFKNLWEKYDFLLKYYKEAEREFRERFYDSNYMDWIVFLDNYLTKKHYIVFFSLKWHLKKLLEEYYKDKIKKWELKVRRTHEEYKAHLREKYKYKKENFDYEWFISQFKNKKHVDLLKKYLEADREGFARRFTKVWKTRVEKFLDEALTKEEKSHWWEFNKIIKDKFKEKEIKKQKRFNVKSFIDSFEEKWIRDFLSDYLSRNEEEFREKYYQSSKLEVKAFYKKYFLWKQKTLSWYYNWTLWEVQRDYFYKIKKEQKQEKINSFKVNEFIELFKEETEKYNFLKNFLEVNEYEFRETFYKMKENKFIDYINKYIWTEFRSLNWMPVNTFWELLKKHYIKKRKDFFVNELKISSEVIDEFPQILKRVSNIREKADEFKKKLSINYEQLWILIEKTRWSILWHKIDNKIEWFKKVYVEPEELTFIILKNQRAWACNISQRIKEAKPLWLTNLELWSMFRKYNWFFISNIAKKIREYSEMWITPIALWRVLKKYPSHISLNTESKVKSVFNLNIFLHHMAKHKKIIIENIKESENFLKDFNESEIDYINKTFEEDFLGFLLVQVKKEFIYDDFQEYINKIRINYINDPYQGYRNLYKIFTGFVYSHPTYKWRKMN